MTGGQLLAATTSQMSPFPPPLLYANGSNGGPAAAAATMKQQQQQQQQAASMEQVRRYQSMSERVRSNWIFDFTAQQIVLPDVIHTRLAEPVAVTEAAATAE